MARNHRDHGGGLDAAIAHFGGARSDWFDLSTGINPRPFPTGTVPPDSWNALPDDRANEALINAARQFWDIPSAAAVLPVPGCSAAIAQIPFLATAATAVIPGPTYNEHAASFKNAGWTIEENGSGAAHVIVHPNNPTGHFWEAAPTQELTIIDESFCDVAPDQTLVALAALPGHLLLKSFGKFWGLAGLRLGFVIGDPGLVQTLKDRLGPWPVSGPALTIGTQALSNPAWAAETRTWLEGQMAAMDTIMVQAAAVPMGSVPLFRTYTVEDAASWQTKLAQVKIWSRVFPYNEKWLRLGVPTDAALARLKEAL